MPVSTTVTGMVLSAMPVGDFDKRLVILTKELGKISAFAKGARKQGSAFLACSQPFSFGEFTLYVGRSSYNVQSAEISNYFAKLRQDFEAMCYGMYFCEFADHMTKENNDEKDTLKLLYQSLRALSKGTIETALIRVVFELKIATINGQAPQVFECVKCGHIWDDADEVNQEAIKTLKQYFFSAECGGILCESCKGYDSKAFRIDTSTLYTMQYIISKEIEGLYTFRVTYKVLQELKRCVKLHLDRYIGHDFKSLEIMKTLS